VGYRQRGDLLTWVGTISSSSIWNGLSRMRRVQKNYGSVTAPDTRRTNGRTVTAVKSLLTRFALLPFNVRTYSSPPEYRIHIAKLDRFSWGCQAKKTRSAILGKRRRTAHRIVNRDQTRQAGGEAQAVLPKFRIHPGLTPPSGDRQNACSVGSLKIPVSRA
jgi:hypothetical protein